MLYRAEFYLGTETPPGETEPPSAFAQNDRLGISSTTPTPTKIADHNGGTVRVRHQSTDHAV
jgi:hypothetical protein